MMSCKKATELLSLSQDQKLSLTDQASLKIHIMMCSGCNNFSTQLSLLRSFSQYYMQGDSSTNKLDDENNF